METNEKKELIKNNLLISTGDKKAPNPLNAHWLWNTSSKEKSLLLILYFLEEEKGWVGQSDIFFSSLMGCSLDNIKKLFRSLRNKNLISCETEVFYSEKTKEYYSLRKIIINKDKLNTSYFEEYREAAAKSLRVVETDSHHYSVIPKDFSEKNLSRIVWAIKKEAITKDTEE